MNVVNIVPMMPPSPPTPKREHPHVSVLVREVLEALSPVRGGTYVDATLGAGGHSEAILGVAGTRVFGADRDQTALGLARARLRPFGDRLITAHARFSELELALSEHGIDRIDGLIADVGVSSMQIDDAARGLSFRAEGPLDMRMDSSRGQTALELIEGLDDAELADVIFHFGEERRSRRIARCIKQSFEAGELRTTLDLRRAVVRAVGPARIGGVDPATRTFQALRVAVNAELDELKALITAAARVVRPGGIIVVIAFHSLEDRIVKHALRERSTWLPITKRPITAGDEEVEDNPRARSAKLRAAQRVDPRDPGLQLARSWNKSHSDDEASEP
jgi:16S rRNA (cytosine1402-N4)-methyltransferase